MMLRVIISAWLFVCVCSISLAANRVISLAPNITEMIYAAGAGQQLVGVSSYSDYPLQAKKLPIVNGFNKINIEEIVSLHPNVIFAQSGINPANDLSQLKRMGYKVYFVAVHRLSDITKTIRMMGHVLGTERVARRYSTRWLAQLQQLKNRYHHKPSIRVFYQMSFSPLLTINQHDVISDALAVCGGVNIFDHLLGQAPEVSIEDVMVAQPQAIIISKPSGYAGDLRKTWYHWPLLKAVQNQQVFQVDSSLIDRAGPRMLQGTAQICRDIN